MTPQEAVDILNMNLIDNSDPEVTEALELLEALVKS